MPRARSDTIPGPRRPAALAAAFEFLSRFTAEPALGRYAEARPRFRWAGPKVPHAVLLIHGFSASPDAFAPLVPGLEGAGLPYLAPRLTGFGLDDFSLLRAARAEDWRRDVFEAYDALKELADDVSVVAVSFGTLIAAELAAARSVRHLVLVAPYFHLQGAGDRRLRAVFARPAARALGLRLRTWIKKPVRPGRATCVDLCDPAAAARFFQYPVLPLASLITVWRYPRDVDWARLPVRSLAVLWGEQEQTSDVPSFLAQLQAAGLEPGRYAYARSGHNLLSDYDGQAACAAIRAILTSSEGA